MSRMIMSARLRSEESKKVLLEISSPVLHRRCSCHCSSEHSVSVNRKSSTSIVQQVQQTNGPGDCTTNNPPDHMIRGVVCSTSSLRTIHKNNHMNLPPQVGVPDVRSQSRDNPGEPAVPPVKDKFSDLDSPRLRIHCFFQTFFQHRNCMNYIKVARGKEVTRRGRSCYRNTDREGGWIK